jgi:hypothetical protein
MVPIIAAILKGLIGGEVAKAVGSDPAAQAGASMAVGRINSGIDSKTDIPSPTMTDQPDQQDQPTPALAMFNANRENDYMNRIRAMMNRRTA